MATRHRDFLHKRSSGAHPGLAARFNPFVGRATIPSALAPVAAAAVPSTDAKSSDAVSVSVSPPAQTADTPSASPSSTTLSTPALSSSSSSSSSSSTSSSSTTTSSLSAATRATSSAISSSTIVVPLSSAHAAPSFATQVVPGVSYTSSALPQTTTTSNSSSSGGVNTGLIIGGIAGTLAAVAVLGFLLMWCMRRQRDRDVDDFDAQAFKRQSAMLVDDPVEPPRSYNPRPPTMIERHNASPALATQAGYNGQNFYGSYGGYSQQPAYAPPEMIQSAGSPPPQAYGAPPMDYTGRNNLQQQLARQPSNAAYLTRQPAAAEYGPPAAPSGSLDPYIDLNRSSVSPYQAAQYADISRQLGATDPNAQVELPDGPLPSPFDDPVEATPNAPLHRLDYPTDAIASAPITAGRALQVQGNATAPHQRPDTVYEEGDAYGGI